MKPTYITRLVASLLAGLFIVAAPSVGSAGIGALELGLPTTHPETPSHGFALVTVRFQVVR
jgi:hypothetical protein